MLILLYPSILLRKTRCHTRDNIYKMAIARVHLLRKTENYQKGLRIAFRSKSFIYYLFDYFLAVQILHTLHRAQLITIS